MTIDERWEAGVEHAIESVELIKLINDLDNTSELYLPLGGDGDLGETLAYHLDELIESGKITITIHK